MIQHTIRVIGGIARNPLVRLAHPLNLDILSDEHIAIVGPNCAGKTLLVDTLIGKYPLAEGSITYDFSPSASTTVYENIKYMAFRDTYGAADANYYYQQRWNAHDQDDAPLVLADYVKDAGKGTRFLACLHCKLYARLAGTANGYKYPEDILIGNDAKQVIVIIHYGHAPNLLVKHNEGDLGDALVAFHADGVGRHDILGLHFCKKVLNFVHFKRCCLGRGSTFDITVGDNANNTIAVIDYRKTTDAVLLHELLTSGKGCVRLDTDGFSGHPGRYEHLLLLQTRCLHSSLVHLAPCTFEANALRDGTREQQLKIAINVNQKCPKQAVGFWEKPVAHCGGHCSIEEQ